MSPIQPTRETYTALRTAYGYFNRALFNNQLPEALVTLQRKKGMKGYYSHEAMERTDGKATVAEIALNPSLFASRTIRDTLSTLVHEMVHLWQFHLGTPPRKAYHNQEWAARMEALGLMPTDTGAPGGKTVGQAVTHYIVEGGRFAQVCKRFLAEHPILLYADKVTPEGTREAAAKRASKTCYQCPDCELKAWAKPEVLIMCGTCLVPLLATA